MPEEEKENTATQEEQVPEKFRGKSVEEIVRAYEELEQQLGRQGQELGQLRAYVQAMQSYQQASNSPPRDEYLEGVRIDDLFTAPEEVVPQIARKVEERVLQKVASILTHQMTTQQRIEAWFRNNPDLDRFREIVAVIGERIYQANPNLPIETVLDTAGREARSYISSLLPRLGVQSGDRDRRVSAMTTGGGTVRPPSTSSSESESAESSLPPDQQEVLDEIRRIKEWRTRRTSPPLTRG